MDIEIRQPREDEIDAMQRADFAVFGESAAMVSSAVASRCPWIF